MKIVSKGPASYEYLDEAMFIRNNYESYARGKRPKIKGMTTVYKQLLIEGALVLLLCLSVFFLLHTGDTLSTVLLIIIGGLAALLGVYIKMYLSTTKAIKTMMESAGERSVEVSSDGVAFASDDMEAWLPWGEILCIVAGNHLIAFLPSAPNGRKPLVGVSVEHKDKLLQALREYGRESLFVDCGK